MTTSKGLSVAAGVILLASILAAEPTWVEFTKGAEGQAPQLTVLESSFSGTTINLETYGMWVEDVEEEGETYQRITLNSSYVGEIGKPRLPAIRKRVAIPAEAGVTVKIESKKEQTFTDYNVYPTQIPETPSRSPAPFKKDEKLYASDTLYPVELSEVSAPAIMRAVRLVHLKIQPFRYNPKKKELTVATELTIRLDYSGYDPRNVLEVKQDRFLPQWECIYRTHILNFEDLYHPVKTHGGGGGGGGIQHLIPVYLMIYADEFKPENWGVVPNPISWKTFKGLKVDTVNLNSIPGIDGSHDDVEDVKDFIQGWYDSYYLNDKYVPNYVLLIGDAPVYDPDWPCGDGRRYLPTQRADDSHIPIYAGWKNVQPGNCHIYSDYYYQTIVGEDDEPDIAIGRWCPEDTTDLNAYINKTFTYEMDPPTSGWDSDEALLVAHIDRPDFFRRCKEDIDEEILTPSGYDPLTEYGNQGGSNAGVTNAIEDNSGVGIVNYQGHGEYREWLEWDKDSQPYTTADINDLDNAEHYPVVYNMACRNGGITHTYDGTNSVEVMVEAWTRNPNGGGVGALGASYDIPASEEVLVFDRSIFRAHYDSTLNCGMAINFGKIAMLDSQTVENFGLYDARAYNWIGDPELDVWRGNPNPANYDYCYAQDGTIYIRVVQDDGSDNPIADAKVCVYKDFGQGVVYQEIGYTDANGCINFSAPPDPVGVTVTATNQWGPITIRPVQTTIGELSSSGVEEPEVEVVDWKLNPIQPNPLQSSTTISYSIGGKVGTKKTKFVELSVFDVTGRRVKTLVADMKAPGHYEVNWEGRDANGQGCPAGVYFVRMLSDECNSDARLVLLR